MNKTVSQSDQTVNSNYRQLWHVFNRLSQIVIRVYNTASELITLMKINKVTPLIVGSERVHNIAIEIWEMMLKSERCRLLINKVY